MFSRIFILLKNVHIFWVRYCMDILFLFGGGGKDGPHTISSKIRNEKGEVLYYYYVTPT